MREAWSLAWPVLVLLIGAGLIGAGVLYAIGSRPTRDYDALLDQAEQLVNREQFADALSVLGREVLAYAGDPEQTTEDRARGHQLTARAIYLGQRAIGADDPRNHERIEREFATAERLGIELPPSDMLAFADTEAALGRADRAIRRANALPGNEVDRRAQVYRAVVERLLGAPKPDYEQVAGLLVALLREPDLAFEDHVWAIEAQTDVRMAQGFVAEAIERLVQQLVRLSPEERAKASILYVRLGEAYAESGEAGKARAQFELAASMTDPADGAHARAQFGLAGLEPDPAAALGVYDAVLAVHSGTPWRLRAVLGRAEALAAQRRIDESAEAYRELASAFAAGEVAEMVTAADVVRSAIIRGRGMLDAGDPQGALAIVGAVEPMTSPERFPADGVLVLAEAHRGIAESMLPESTPIARTVTIVERLDDATRAEARSRLLAAGRYFTEYARRVVLTDQDAYADAVWLAADCYDLGGSPATAIAAFGEFASGFPGDPRRPEAMYRLARTLQAVGDDEQAIDLFRELRETPAGNASPTAGIWSDAALTPLAQTLLADPDPENDAEAIDLLTRAVEGEAGGPGSEVFREALFELGRVFYERGDGAALARLKEAIERFPEDERIATVRYRLADAYRRVAERIAKDLASPGLPTGEAEGLRQARAEALRESLGLFERARDALEEIDPRRRTEAETLYLRNARFYLGDVAFDLGDYAAAVVYYDEAREVYADDPAALVAMVQIVNAHVAEGDMERARAANERARRLFMQLPDEVWDDPQLPMQREEWERWLDSTAQLYTMGNG